jgi:DNA invertase Pin-like site-specific DNA recombinase
MAETKKFGYARISDKSQNIERQIKALIEYGIDERDIFVDKESGKDFDREQYILLKKILRKGDTLVIKELDRLGRNMDGIKQEWNWFLKNGINIIILDMPLLNTENKTDLEKKLIADIVLSLLSYLSERERLKIRQRQAEGILIRKAKGLYKGRKRKDLSDFNSLYFKWKEGSISALEACRQLNISSPTFYRRVKELEAKKYTNVDLKSKTHEELNKWAKIIEKS